MAAVTHAEKMVAKLEDMLLKHAGKRQIQNDGQMVTFADLKDELTYWKREVAAEQKAATSGISAKPAVATIDLSS